MGWERQEWIIELGQGQEEGPEGWQPFPFVMTPGCFNSEMLEK